MSQFRTFQDIKVEILTKAGEVTNGNSPYESVAITYANRAHGAIIGGANIFNLQVAEPWVWARARNPIVLELQPCVSGTATFTSAATTFAFGSAPTQSLEGWHIQASGKSTVYKITSHTASATAAQLDSNFVNTSGGYGFRAFKLDYDVLPQFLYVDSSNDRLDARDAAATAAYSAAIPHGSYTPDGLASAIAAAMQSASGSNTYSGGYDTVACTFSITATSSFTLLGATGASVRRSTLPTLGFDYLNTTSSVSGTAYVARAAYSLNRVSRMIEPFKVFTGGTQQPFIYSSDPIRMQQDYPLYMIRERIPDRFVRLTEDNNGAVRVRFNGFPKELSKVQIDWIPTPLDLQDNTASMVLLPRSDVETLIHIAAAYILLDKEDDKFPQIAGFAKDGLNAMMANNRLELQRTGEFFGQIIPRQDLVRDERNRLAYGYTSGGN